VYVLSVDRDTKKIALSLKRAQPDPWTLVDQKYRVGEVVPAVITKLAKFGAFAKVEDGLEGLIHLSELTDQPVTDAAQVVQEGQHVLAKIIHINSQRRRLGLSVRQAQEPRSEVESFGEVGGNTPFATHDFSSYRNGNSVMREDDYPSDPTTAFSPESEYTTGAQDSPAAESEPSMQPHGDASTAAPSGEASPASTEASVPGDTIDEADRPEVASAISPTSVSE
jgi:small subunit ribosomal protein S1